MDETYIQGKGAWRERERAVDHHGPTIAFLLTQARDAQTAQRFRTQAIRRHGVPAKITLDGSAAQEGAIKSDTKDHGTTSGSRQVKYLKKIVEQDHRAVNWVPRPRLGFTSLAASQQTLVGSELRHMIKKQQRVVEAGNAGLTAAEPCSALASSFPHRPGQPPL